MGNQTSSKSFQQIPNPEINIKKALLRSHEYIQNCPLIIDLEEKLLNHIIVSYEMDYNAENHKNEIYNKLLESSNPFWIFDVPYQDNLKKSIYPIDVILGLYSNYDKNIIIQLYISDIFVGKYTLIPHTIIPLKRFLLRFIFYGLDDINIKFIDGQDMHSSIRLICCILDNQVRKNWVFNCF
jgi:hypothetical protein